MTQHTTTTWTLNNAPAWDYGKGKRSNTYETPKEAMDHAKTISGYKDVADVVVRPATEDEIYEYECIELEMEAEAPLIARGLL